jgi:threonine/homoserine/homoserine lactone efflux protein
VLTSVLAFAGAAALLVVLPGPDSVLVLRAGVLGGRARAARAGAGIVCGLLVWVGAATVGLAALLRASETGYTVLRLVGAAYLVWLGLAAWGVPLPGRRTRLPDPPRRGPRGTGFRAGLVTNVLNPKVGVFFVTFLPGFVPAGAPVAPTSLLLGAVYVALTLAWFGVLVVLLQRAGRWLARDAVQRGLDRVAGVFLVGFGARLALHA